MNWLLIVENKAQKQLRKLPRPDQERIAQALDQMRLDPFAGDFGKLTARGLLWRRRVGAYRILLTVDQRAHTVRVHDVVRRTTTTYR